jgi:hypothetical protein
VSSVRNLLAEAVGQGCWRIVRFHRQPRHAVVVGRQSRCGQGRAYRPIST